MRSGRAGKVCTRFTLRPPSPNTFFLKVVGRVAAVTLSFSGVSASYMKSWSREWTVVGRVPNWPGGRMLNASPGDEKSGGSADAAPA